MGSTPAAPIQYTVDVKRIVAFLLNAGIDCAFLYGICSCGSDEFYALPKFRWLEEGKAEVYVRLYCFKCNKLVDTTDAVRQPTMLVLDMYEEGLVG